MPQDPSAAVIASDAGPGTEPLSWQEVRQRFDAERWYWMATAGPDGRPHVRPVLAVWMDDKVYSTTSPGARKGRNLQARPECSIAARAPAIDIVVEGATTWVDDRTPAGADRRGLSPQVRLAGDHHRGEHVHRPLRRTNRRPPPYRAYEITPRVVYAFGTSDNLGARSTRFHLPPD